jgi:hypothetical protein
MQGAAQVAQNNPVFMDNNELRIKLTGSLTSSPAANIELAASDPYFISGATYTLLSGAISGNNGKFLVKGESGKIDTSGRYTVP